MKLISRYDVLELFLFVMVAVHSRMLPTLQVTLQEQLPPAVA